MAENEAMRGIYVHIPFCSRKCGYCDFYSVVGGEEDLRGYGTLVVRELETVLRFYPGEARIPADTVYFGGGTPTVLGPDRLCRLLGEIRGLVPVAEGAEITVEANPGTVTEEDLCRLREGGFTRLSLGVQSFHPPTLRMLGRIHTAGEADAAFRDARKAGFRSVGLDLMFGIPAQEAETWRGDLRHAVAIAPDHLSAYALSPEPGTPLHAQIARAATTLPPDDAVARMYDTARELLSSAGYRHYEISNFARPGRECQHNGKYWDRAGYLGLGPSAHGLLFPGEHAPLGLRTANPPALRDYARRLGEGRLPWISSDASRPEDAWKEFLILGLRRECGVSLPEGEKRYGLPPGEVRKAVEDLTGSGALIRDGSRIRIPGPLWFVSNEVLHRFA
ncbi:MAG: radical SAM family heme chaperone HemW [Verrucomicrobiota bacterium]